MYKQNLHTHTYYCDGKDSPEEMVLAAMTLDNAQKYRQEVETLKEKYAGFIDLFETLSLQDLTNRFVAICKQFARKNTSANPFWS